MTFEAFSDFRIILSSYLLIFILLNFSTSTSIFWSKVKLISLFVFWISNCKSLVFVAPFILKLLFFGATDKFIFESNTPVSICISLFIILLRLLKFRFDVRMLILDWAFEVAV